MLPCWLFCCCYCFVLDFVFVSVTQTTRNLSAMYETQLWSLGQEDPLEEGVAIHSSILVWRILWTEEPDWLQSMGSQRVRNEWAADTHTQIHTQTCSYPLLLQLYPSHIGCDVQCTDFQPGISPWMWSWVDIRNVKKRRVPKIQALKSKWILLKKTTQNEKVILCSKLSCKVHYLSWLGYDDCKKLLVVWQSAKTWICFVFYFAFQVSVAFLCM